MTLEEKQKKLAELRVLYKTATTDVDRKIILVRANLIKKSIKTLI
jgi:hypothetical protein